MKEKIRIGFVGCGQFAQNFVPLFKVHPACEYVAVCDKFRDRAEDYMERFKDFTINEERFPNFPEYVKKMKAQNCFHSRLKTMIFCWMIQRIRFLPTKSSTLS